MHVDSRVLLLPGYESDSVVTECVWLGRINNQTGGSSKTGKSPKRWMVYTNKSCTIYTSYGCPVGYLCCDEGQGMEFNLTLKSSREPASTTEDGTRFHSLMDLGKKQCWYVSFFALICPSLVSSCSGVPCCVIVGWFNGNQLMVDLVAHYKGLFPSSLLEGFPLKTV